MTDSISLLPFLVMSSVRTPSSELTQLSSGRCLSRGGGGGGGGGGGPSITPFSQT